MKGNSIVHPVWPFTRLIRPAGRAGFSLLEVLLAVALGAMLLVAVNFFVLSMGELWSGGSEARLFDRHVRGVTRFLESLVNQSVVLEDAGTTGTARSTTVSSVPLPTRSGGRLADLILPVVDRGTTALAVGRGVGFGWSCGLFLAQALPGGNPGGHDRPPGARPPAAENPTKPRPDAGSTRRGQSQTANSATGPRFRFGSPNGYDGLPPMLMFEVDEAPGQCVWPDRPLPQVECALQINADEGLVLLWKSKLEEDYGETRPRKTQLSPLAQAMSFDYFDAEKGTWQHTEQPLADGQGGWLVPQRIRISFAYEGRTREVSIALPDALGGAPLR